MDISNDDYLDLIYSKYGNLDGDLMIIDLSRNQLMQQINQINNPSFTFSPKNTSLGLSLAGNKNRSVYSVFVCGIHPQGLAGKDGRIKIGDQLIEANGVQLLGRCHLNTGPILQQLPGYHIKLVVLRKSNAIEEMAVKPLTIFPNDDLITKKLGNSLFAHSLSNEIMDKYKESVKIVTLKKESKGLGLMITEDKHVDLGQGIFISEIYPGSVAEKSELEIGDMLISVNQIQLINMDCDVALNVLKSIDGLLTLVALKTTKRNESSLAETYRYIFNSNMYQFFNCLTGDPVKFIRRLKIIKRKDRKANLEKTRKNELTTNLNLLNEYAKQFSTENLEPNDNKVKLISYSKNPKSVIDEIREKLKEVKINYEVETIPDNEIEINLVNNSKEDNTLEKIVEEDEELKFDDKQLFEDLKNNSLDQKISDEILHVLHVNSIDCRPTNDICNSDKKNENEKTFDDKKELTLEKNDSDSKENFDINKMTNTSDDNLTINKTNLNNLKLKDDENKNNKPSVKFNTDETTNDNLEDKTKFNKKFPDTSDLKTAPILAGIETWIELVKENESALGIKLISRNSNDEELFIVHELLNNGIAKEDKRLKIGDVLLQINDIVLKNITLAEANSHLNKTSGSVKLLVYREFICLSEINGSESSKNEALNDSKTSKNFFQENQKIITEQKVIDGRLYEILQVDLQKKTNKGLGLCIVNDFGNSPGPFISEILPSSIAFLEGSLKKGDHIISINGQDFTKESENTALTALKCLSGTINLKIARLKPGQVISLDIPNSNQSVKSKKINFKVLTFNSNKTKKTTIKHKQLNRVVNKLKEIESYSDLSLLNETIDSKCLDHSISKNWIKIDRSKTNLREDLQSIDSGLDEQFIDELEKNDQIIEINGQTFEEKNKDELINKIKKLSSLVLMVVSI